MSWSRSFNAALGWTRGCFSSLRLIFFFYIPFFCGIVLEAHYLKTDNLPIKHVRNTNVFVLRPSWHFPELIEAIFFFFFFRVACRAPPVPKHNDSRSIIHFRIDILTWKKNPRSNKAINVHWASIEAGGNHSKACHPPPCPRLFICVTTHARGPSSLQMPTTEKMDCVFKKKKKYPIIF